jgi:Flp pilus assembly protein TadB
VSAALVAGAALGCGILLVAGGVAPARVPLSVAIDRVHQPRTAGSPRHGSAWVDLVGGRLTGTGPGRRLVHRFDADLGVAQRLPDEVAARTVLGVVAGLVWAPAVAALMAAGGVAVPWTVPAWGSLLLAAAGGLLPVMALKAEARRRRRAFRHALGCYLDLVAVRLAGGAGVDGALNDSAAAGQGWAFVELRRALGEARLMGEAPWGALSRLGDRLGVPELCQLAASTALAGGEGAKVRTSIAAKARAIRTQGLADAEADAQSASERMSLPVVLLMVGFVAFLGYPAVMQVLTGL